MKTILELARLAEGYLQSKGVPSARLEAEWLVAEVLKIDRLTIYLDSSKPVDDIEQAFLRDALRRRGEREPLQYILGEVSFLDCILKVDPSVLIPRPETEILVDKIIKAIPEGESKTFWDVCCGSGAIGIAVKKARPDLKVILSDISKEALSLAKLNAERNEVKVEFLEGDFLNPFAGKKTDYLATNPPYIAEMDYEKLEPEVKDHEPKGALVSGVKGDEFYKRLAEEVPSYLNSGAVIWMELGPSDTQKLFETPFWKSQKTENDYSGMARYLTVVQNPLNFK